MVGMKYSNNRPGENFGRIATVKRYDEKAKTVTLMYDDGNGGVPISLSTLKRWWKKVNVETVKPTVEPNAASDGTPYKQVMKEIIKDGKKAQKEVKMKEKKEKVKKERKETVPAFDSQSLREFVIAYCENTLNGTITERKKGNGSSMSKLALKVEGHMFATMSWSKKAVSINVRSSVKYNTPTKVFNNTIFGSHYIVSEDTKTVRTMISELLEKAVDDQLNRKSTKKNKEEK